MQDNVRTIGKCPGCQKQASLQDGCCKVCSSRFGPKFGVYASRIRSDDGFKRKCYELLKTDRTKQEFVDMFGDPAMGSTRVAGGSP